MSISPVNMSAPAVDLSAASGGGGNARIKALEQKLQKLNEDNEKAVQQKDTEKVKKLEEEIRKVEKQLEQLKKTEKNKQQEEKAKKEGQEQGNPGQVPEDLLNGKYVDRYA